MTGEIACEWALVTAPTIEPVTLAEVKKQASIVSSDDDGLIISFISAKRQAAEAYLNRALLTQTWKVQLPEFADVVWLPMAAPLQSVTSVQYYDTAGVQQTLASTYYTVDTTSEPGRIVRAPNQSWPAVQSDRLRPVTITYVCGYTTADNVPDIIKHGIRLAVAYADADRHGDAAGDAAMKAAEACWQAGGVVFWRPPESCL